MEDEVKKRETEMQAEIEARERTTREQSVTNPASVINVSASRVQVNKSEKRTKSVQEILNIEKNYVSVLSLVIRVCNSLSLSCLKPTYLYPEILKPTAIICKDDKASYLAGQNSKHFLHHRCHIQLN
jgi:hypothetical protein